MGAQVMVSMPTIRRDGAQTVVTADVEVSGSPPVTVWYRCPVEQVGQEQALDAFFVLALVPAMSRSATLMMPGPVSRDLLRQAETFQDIFGQWFPGVMTPVPVVAPVRSEPPTLPEGRGRACCFTAGVDSFYSVINAPEPLTYLVYVHGFDIPLRAVRYRRRISRRLNAASGQLGIPLLEVETNLRELTDPHGHWPKHVHGSAIASVGLLLADRIGELVIASSQGAVPHSIYRPHGSHHITDRLHGSEYLSVVNHAAGVSRITKTKAVAEHPVAARQLRVCFKSRTAYNCGACLKCRRTLLDLYALRLRRNVRTFDQPPTRKELLDNVAAGLRNRPASTQNTFDYVRANGGPPDIERALKRAIDAYALEQQTESLLTHLASADPDNPAVQATVTALVAALPARTSAPYRT
jgi:hypothetical protein